MQNVYLDSLFISGGKKYLKKLAHHKHVSEKNKNYKFE